MTHLKQGDKPRNIYRCWVYVEEENVDEAIKKAIKKLGKLGFTKKMPSEYKKYL